LQKYVAAKELLQLSQTAIIYGNPFTPLFSNLKNFSFLEKLFFEHAIAW
jgi:hypothetical protein